MRTQRLRFVLLLPLLALVAAIWPGPEQQKSLAPDARVATVLDRQGLVFVRPVARDRWTPLAPKDLIFPGDLVRTGLRGANAGELTLQGGGQLLLGPATMLELKEGRHVQLYRGEVELAPGKDAKLRVTGPGGYDETLTERRVLRAQDDRVAALEHDPRWLTGYRQSTTDEWMGSLLAKVDGRDVALSVGYHKVDVVIRDQIAQTTVEQSFVNSTKSRLEGVFYFPLPADASISGFGMWIGGELVMADIVEKQRARQIYEDILRRKKDPGLLEWSGGNLFKARVFPIEPNSEKRIKIRYTQVLPLEGNSYRYRHALRSELLQARPLRELALKVSVESAIPLKAVVSPTHEMRVRTQGHVASAEFEAQEYSPDRDFELRVDLAQVQPLTTIAHRRGDDGYFMLLLTPPDETGGGWQRDLVPEGEPLRLLLYADTSASMDADARSTQSEFLRALLAQLGPKDRFRLSAVDVQVRHHSEDAVPANEDNVARALAWLDERASLGWSDLDAMLADAVTEANASTQVIYVGDGIVTTGAADPAAFAARIAGQNGRTEASFHAVSVSSTYEKLVLDAFADVGGGSVRSALDGEIGAARSLLAEIARPAIKGLELRFEGVRTARVYPERLPNLAAGTQQIVLGRYQPTEGEQRGTVIVTGTREGEPLQFRSEFVLPAGDAGNSFLPRLWARRHLDFLLAQGASQEIQDEIVGFSQEFGIMTPYTSFLVLESDEDRERYGVERRVAMRDGERFFTEAKDKVQLEMLREQMKLAQGWRQNLRRAFLRQLAELGRGLVPSHVQVAWAEVRHDRYAGLYFDDKLEELGLETRTATRLGGGGGRAGGYRGPSDSVPMAPGSARAWDGAAEPEASAARRGEADSLVTGNARMPEEGRAGADRQAGAAAEPESELMDLEEELEAIADDPAEPSAGRPAGPSTPAPMARRARSKLAESKNELGESLRSLEVAEKLTREQVQQGYFQMDEYGVDFRGVVPSRPVIFPVPWLGATPDAPAAFAPPTWAPEVLELVRALDRRSALKGLPGLLQVEMQGGAVQQARQSWDVAWRTEALLGDGRYHVVRIPRGGEPMADWLLEDRRGVLSLAYELGRTRAAAPHEKELVPLQLTDGSLLDLVRRFHAWSAEIEGRDGDIVLLRLRAPAPSQESQLWRIDAARRIVLQRERYVREERLERLVYADFVTVLDRAWPTRIEHFDRQDRVTRRVTIAWTALDAGAAEQALAERTRPHAQAILLPAETVTTADARQLLFEGKAGLAERFALAEHYAGTQQWDEAWEQFTAFAQLAGDKPGLAWMRLGLLAASRRGTELVAALREKIDAVATQRGPIAHARADRLQHYAAQHLAARQQLRIAEQLAPVYSSEGRFRDAMHLQNQRRRASLLRSLQQPADAHAILAALAAEFPHEVSAQTQQIDVLFELGRVEEAMRFTASVLERAWEPHEREQLWHTLTDGLYERREIHELDRVLALWVEEQPEGPAAYVRWISMRIYLDQLEMADAWILEQLRAAPGPKPESSIEARLFAAVQLALGNGWHWSGQHVEEPFREPLMSLAILLCKREDLRYDYTGAIVGHQRFRRTEEYQATREALLWQLRADDGIEELSLQQLERFFGWIDWRANFVFDAVFNEVASRVRGRWDRTEDQNDRARLATILLHRLYGPRGLEDPAIEFLRARLARAEGSYRAHVASELLPRLAKKEWSQETQDELFRLAAITLLEEGSEELQRIRAAMRARWLGEKLQELRLAHEMGAPKEYEQLSREELQLHKKNAKDRMRQALAAAFATEAEQREAPYATWLKVEGISFAIERGEELAPPVATAKELLRGVPPVSEESEEADVRASYEVLRERLATILSYASIRRNAPDGLADEVLALLREMDAQQPKAADWKQQIVRLLVVLDRVDELEKTLRGYIEPGRVDPTWRVWLGWIRAELGELKDAVALFEEAARNDGLAADQYATLARWYLVLGQDDERAGALVRQYRKTPEYTLANMISNEYYRLRRRDAGPLQSLQPEVLLAERVLFEKASHPQNHLWRVRNLYSTTKDFRVLAPLVYGAQGHAPSAIYPFLQQMHGILEQVHEEATLDPFRAALDEEIAQATNDTDRRALRLLQCFVLARAAQVLNAPEQYEQAALAAMRAAWPGDYAESEVLALAQMLSQVGKVLPVVDRERLDALEKLYVQFGGEPFEKLQLAGWYARAQQQTGRTADAVETLRQALQVYAEPMQGRLDERAGGHAEMLIGWLGQLGRFRVAERLIDRQLALQQSFDQRLAWEERLFGVGILALRQGGTLELGTGEALYLALKQRIEKQLFTAPVRITRTLNFYENLLGAAKDGAKLRRVEEDAVRFGREVFPELLPLAFHAGDNLITSYANALNSHAVKEPAIDFGVTRIEKQPRWYARAGISLASRLDYSLARWRSEARSLESGLERRLLTIVLEALEQDLLQGGRRMNAFYWRSNRWFWGAKSAEYARVAGRVLELHGESVPIVERTAGYLWNGLARRQSAIDALRGLEARGRLDHGGRWQLAVWLQETGEWAESLALLDKLLEHDALNLNYRGRKVQALFRLGRREEAVAFLDASKELFKKHERWNEQHIAFLADRCHEAELWSRAAELYQELIPLHQRTHRGRGVGNGRLSQYYGKLAGALAGLERWDEAVDAASAAVVAWGRSSQNREKAIQSLRNVLRQLPDLDAFVARRDELLEKTGEAAPLLRKLIGEIYLARHMPAKAVPQLELAIELQPSDQESWDRLLGAFDMLSRPEAAEALLLRRLARFPWELETYEQLARRLEKRGDELARRAWTSLVEVKPNEPEGHAKLARHWQDEGQWQDAAQQWEQVVRTQPEDPEGWFALARAQKQAGRGEAARATVERMLGQAWDERFGDVKAKAAELLRQL